MMVSVILIWPFKLQHAFSGASSTLRFRKTSKQFGEVNYFGPLVSRNYWSYTGWSNSYQYLCFPVSGFLEVRHIEDLSLSLYVYNYIYIHIPRSYQHVSEDTATHVFQHILCIYTDDDSRVLLGRFKWPNVTFTNSRANPLALSRGTRPPLSVVPLFGTRGIRSFVVPCTMLQHPGPVQSPPAPMERWWFWWWVQGWVVSYPGS